MAEASSGSRGGWFASFRRRPRPERRTPRPQTWGPHTYRAPGVVPPVPNGPRPFDRHTAIGGYSQDALAAATILLIGAGGLNARVGLDLGRKGVRRLIVCDPDGVDVTNLNRTPYLARQIGSPKPYALAELIQASAVAATEIWTLPATFQGCRREGLDLACTLAVAGSAVDVVDVSAGLALYAIDSLLMDRPRAWDLFTVSLDCGRETGPRRLPRNPACPICGVVPAEPSRQTA